MGTRNLICVFYKGRFVVAQYGQLDGYIEGQGVKIFKFLSVPINIQRLKDGLNHIREPSEQDQFPAYTTSEMEMQPEVIAYREFCVNPDMELTDEIMDKLLPSLRRDTCAGILEVIAWAKADRKVPIKFELSFANDGLLCEWAYVIDLDSEELEVFRGSQTKQPGHRFEYVGSGEDTVPVLVSSIEFSELQGMKDMDEFVNLVNKDIEKRGSTE